MDEFCGSKFWDLNVTWYTEDPDFTPCFQRTALVWGPCAFLWVFSLMELVYIRNSKDRNIPLGFFNVSKMLINLGLILLSVADSIIAINGDSSPEIRVALYTPVIKIATFTYALVLLHFNRRHGLQTSGLLWLFWFILSICAIPQCRALIRTKDENDALGVSKDTYEFFSFMVFFAGSWAMLLLNSFADKAPLDTTYVKTEKTSPELSSGFLSRIFFFWFDKLVWNGYRNPLQHTDLWDMKPEDAAGEVMPQFAKYWNKTIAQRNAHLRPILAKASYSRDNKIGDENVKFVKPPRSAPKSVASILPALCKAFGPTFLFGAMLKLAQDVLTFVSPQLLKWLISFVGDPEAEDWKGILFAVLLFAVASTQTLFLAQYFNRMMFVGLRIRTALVSAIYRKSLIMSNSARKESTVGEIVNLMAVDAQRFMDLTTYINMIWSAPLQIGLALYFLWDILGPSVLAGLAVMIILIPVNMVIANKVKTLQIRQMKNKDERVKLMNEILSGIKVLKLYAWEPSFEGQVLKIRDKEVQVLKEQAYLNAGTSFIWSCAPFMVTLVTFAAYILSSDDNVLTPEKAFVCLTLFDIIRMPLALLPLLLVYIVEVALVTFAVFVLVDENNHLTASTAFVSLSLFNILRFPMSMLPMLISNMVQTGVSVKRINKFMNADELDPNDVQHEEKSANDLGIDNGTFSWGGDENCLHDINMTAKKGDLVAVVGSVGSGKSSIVSAFLGEMERVSGVVNTNGTIAYVSQQAWIQNATLKDNILFGKPYDKATYDRVVEACALKPDFDMLPAGDQTEIGEKGINLSGGQKQRVSLARAAYSDADIYFLDDPLSAVDSHVGKHIFEKVLGPSGMLGKKTRLLVTHGIVYLPEVDNIYVMKEGRISESGSYKDLLSKKGAFAEFLIQHIQETNNEDSEDLDELKQTLESSIDDKELRDKLEKAISTRARSESQSETGSLKGTLSRQNSVSSGDGENGGLRKRKPSAEQAKQEEEDKEKDTLIEQEKAETGSVKWPVYKHYLKSIGMVLSIATIILNMMFQGFSIGSNIWLAQWSTDERAANDTGVRDMYLGVYGALGFGQGFTSIFCDLFPQIGCLRAAAFLHLSLLAGILKAPLRFFDKTPSGRILSRFSKDIDVLDTSLPEQISTIIYCFYEVVATLVVISISTPIFMSVILPIGLLYYFVQRFYVATSRQLKRLESVSRSPIYSHFGETIQGAQTIRAYNVQKRFISESEDKVDFNQVCYSPSIIANRWLAVRLEMVGNLIILFAALFAVLDRENATPGSVGLSVSYALQVTQTLNWLVRMTSDVETNIVAVERIKEYGETAQEAAWENPNAVVPVNWPESGTVEFKDFQVRYRENLDLVLRGITFSVKGGEKVGIVGRTGAGKSSLTLALFRIIEAAGGKIYIDGQDLSKLGLHTLRSRLTIIPQDPVLFSGSMRMNLDPFNKFSDEEVWNALTHAHLASFIKGLAAGLNHEVTEGGENLSVGQRQLVCLARALLRKTKVLILDEATAAVDLETDDLIQKTIRTEFKGCTVLTIAHRLNTIMDSDKVLVLDKGQISEFNSPTELLQDKKSAFYSMAKDAGLV